MSDKIKIDFISLKMKFIFTHNNKRAGSDAKIRFPPLESLNQRYTIVFTVAGFKLKCSKQLRRRPFRSERASASDSVGHSGRRRRRCFALTVL